MKKTALFTALMLFAASLNTYAAVGDANADGVIDDSDAAYTFSRVLKSSFRVDTAMADVDGDGEITSADAAAIMQKTLNNAYIFEKEKKDPVVENTAENAADLPYGVYSKPFSFGDVTVSPGALGAAVKDVYLCTDFVTGERQYAKALVLADGGALFFDNGTKAELEQLFTSNAEYSLNSPDYYDKNGENIEQYIALPRVYDDATASSRGRDIIDIKGGVSAENKTGAPITITEIKVE